MPHKDFDLGIELPGVKIKETNFDMALLDMKMPEMDGIKAALKNINQPVGVSSYYTTKKLPKELQNLLPTIEEIEEKLKY